MKDYLKEGRKVEIELKIAHPHRLHSITWAVLLTSITIVCAL
jgi:hypothetical protein